MASDGVYFLISDTLTQLAIDAKLVATDRAAMWVAREAGRTARRAASAAAPVATGALAASPHSSRSLTGGFGNYSVKVAPEGRPHLYAPKEQARSGFMTAGREAAAGAMTRIAVEGFGKVWL